MKKKLFYAFAICVALFSSCKEKDESAPVVTIVGRTLDRVLCPKTYKDPGATATDYKDGDLTSKIVAHSSIDCNMPNITSDIYYTVSDAAGNEGSSGQRLVMVIGFIQYQWHTGTLNYWDTPELTLTDTLKFKKFAGYTDARVNAFMPSDSTFTIPVQTVTCGDAPQIPRTFSGSGTLSFRRTGASVETTININYTKVENGVTTTGTITN